MEKLMKKTFFIFLAALMIVSVFAFAEETDSAATAEKVKITVGTVSGEQGDMVSLPVNIESKTPINSVTVRFSFDKDALEYINYAEIADKGDVNFNIMVGVISTDASYFGIAAASATPVDANGLLCKVRFNIKDAAKAGQSPIKVIYTDISASTESGSEKLEAETLDGYIDIKAASSGSSSGGGRKSGGGTISPITVIEPNDGKLILKIGSKNAKAFGKDVENDVAPIIRNDRTMLPARFIAENLGATVEWNADEKKVTITNGSTVIEIFIGRTEAYINGVETALDSPAFIENDRTYTPVRFIAEALSANVEWNEETQEVTITKK